MASVRVLVLGTAQDGGVPHPGCDCARCSAARRDPRRRRLVASIGVVGATGKTFLVDATPDLREQADALRAASGTTARFVDAIGLTHAHVGHYLGLAFLGKEAMHAKGLAVYATPKMARFVEGNRPWSHLVERDEIELRPIAPGAPLAFDGAMIHAFLSPHRGEDTDTIGFEISGPTRRLVYVSDADVLPPAIVDRIRDADVALVDGTFYDRSELPGRDILEVKHPFVAESLPKLAGARGRVLFTHLNHSNPLLDPDAAARRSLPKGFEVAEEGMVFDL
jgi:pyrroloquinoline quinone biosynthesis protein B